jgi:UDP-N-acetylmuramate dehydrogenase
VVETLPKESISFSYRTSTFKQDSSYVVCAVTFALQPGDAKAGEQAVEDDLRSRRMSQPYEFPSMGSVFTNPASKVYAGKLIDEAGLKGLRIGGAEVSEKHANFIINRGGATVADILSLIAEIKRRVREHSGIELHEEIVVA